MREPGLPTRRSVPTDDAPGLDVALGDRQQRGEADGDVSRRGVVVTPAPQQLDGRSRQVQGDLAVGQVQLRCRPPRLEGVAGVVDEQRVDALERRPAPEGERGEVAGVALGDGQGLGAGEQGLEAHGVDARQVAGEAEPVVVVLDAQPAAEHPPELGDLLVQAVAGRLGVVGPQVLDQLGAGHDPPGRGGEDGEDAGSLRGERDLGSTVDAQDDVAEDGEIDGRRSLRSHGWER